MAYFKDGYKLAYEDRYNEIKNVVDGQTFARILKATKKTLPAIESDTELTYFATETDEAVEPKDFRVIFEKSGGLFGKTKADDTIVEFYVKCGDDVIYGNSGEGPTPPVEPFTVTLSTTIENTHITVNAQNQGQEYTMTVNPGVGNLWSVNPDAGYVWAEDGLPTLTIYDQDGTQVGEPLVGETTYTLSQLHDGYSVVATDGTVVEAPTYTINYVVDEVAVGGVLKGSTVPGFWIGSTFDFPYTVDNKAIGTSIETIYFSPKFGTWEEIEGERQTPTTYSVKINDGEPYTLDVDQIQTTYYGLQYAIADSLNNYLSEQSLTDNSVVTVTINTGKCEPTYLVTASTDITGAIISDSSSQYYGSESYSTSVLANEYCYLYFKPASGYTWTTVPTTCTVTVGDGEPEQHNLDLYEDGTNSIYYVEVTVTADTAVEFDTGALERCKTIKMDSHIPNAQVRYTDTTGTHVVEYIGDGSYFYAAVSTEATEFTATIQPRSTYPGAVWVDAPTTCYVKDDAHTEGADVSVTDEDPDYTITLDLTSDSVNPYEIVFDTGSAEQNATYYVQAYSIDGDTEMSFLKTSGYRTAVEQDPITEEFIEDYPVNVFIKPINGYMWASIPTTCSVINNNTGDETITNVIQVISDPNIYQVEIAAITDPITIVINTGETINAVSVSCTVDTADALVSLDQDGTYVDASSDPLVATISQGSQFTIYIKPADGESWWDTTQATPYISWHETEDPDAGGMGTATLIQDTDIFALTINAGELTASSIDVSISANDAIHQPA